MIFLVCFLTPLFSGESPFCVPCGSRPHLPLLVFLYRFYVFDVTNGVRFSFPFWPHLGGLFAAVCCLFVYPSDSLSARVYCVYFFFVGAFCLFYLPHPSFLIPLSVNLHKTVHFLSLRITHESKNRFAVLLTLDDGQLLIKTKKVGLTTTKQNTSIYKKKRKPRKKGN